MKRIKRRRSVKKLVRFIAVIVVAALVAGTSPVAAFAKTGSGTPASSLAVYLTSGGKTELLHDYTIDEMSDLIDGKNVRYSSIDALPARVLTVGNGVYIDTLISDVTKYTDADLTDFEKIKLTATDGWTRTHTRSDIYAEKYYYKNLFNTDTWDLTVEKAGASAAADAVSVKPMLAVISWQSRVMENTGDVSSLIGEMSGETIFRLCLGMSLSDLTSGDSTTSEYGKWINQIEIFLNDAGTESQTEWNNGFKDITEKDWFYGAVRFACSNNLFQGTGKDTFSPNGTMTRAMFVTVLGRMAKADVSDYNTTFKDVVPGQYYEGYVAWASGNNIISGSGEGMFRPDDRITREQMALIIYRYAKLRGIDVSDTDSVKFLSYQDYESVMDSAKEAACWAVNKGIITGSGGKLEPKGEASRAQVAQIMKNFSGAGGPL